MNLQEIPINYDQWKALKKNQSVCVSTTMPVLPGEYYRARAKSPTGLERTLICVVLSVRITDLTCTITKQYPTFRHTFT